MSFMVVETATFAEGHRVTFEAIGSIVENEAKVTGPSRNARPLQQW